MQKISNCLWFDNQAEDAVNFYLSIFKNSREFETVNNTWQIVPARLPDLIKKPNAMQAMLKMKKLDIAE